MKITEEILNDYFTQERLNAKLEDSIVFAKSVLAGLEDRLNKAQHPDLVMELSKQVSEWAELTLILQAKVPTDVNPKTMLNPAEEELCRENKRIQAIKLVRERLHNGLKEAKDLVDAACVVLGVPGFGSSTSAPVDLPAARSPLANYIPKSAHSIPADPDHDEDIPF